MEERLTKKEKKELRKLENLSKVEEGGGNKMKLIIIAAVSFLFLAFFAFAIIASKQKANAPVKLSNSGWVTGNPNSKVTLTEFGDFQCPACKAFEPVIDQVRKDYGNKIKIVFMHFPLKNAHPNAMMAAKAAEAAGQQGKFWQYHDLLYVNQEAWAPLPDPTQQFTDYAKSLKLDTAKFKKDMQDSKLEAKINAQEDEGINVGVNATPTVYLNGAFLGVPDGYDALKKEIDKALNAVN
ncbi:MAG: DsbA family protein [Candidatus Levyibacteriota bacterium]